MHLVRAAVFFCLYRVAETADLCLPDAVLEIERAYIKDVTGENTEIRLIAYDWPSAEFVTALSTLTKGKIMIGEALGLKVKINEARGVQNLDAVLSITGCNSLECTSQNVTHVSHVALESWLGAYGGDYESFKDHHPDIVPEDLGSMGYPGEEAMFVSRAVVEDAYEESGHSLNWYRSYNVSKSSARKYFNSVLDLPIEDFHFCNDSTVMWTDPLFLNHYARWSGDTEGLLKVGDGWHAKCDGFGRFWLSPACRHNVSECIPLLSNGYGWLVDAFMAWSTAYGIPAAVGIVALKFPSSTWASGEYYYSMARTFRVAFNPLPIIFPVHSASEWAAGNKRSAAHGSYIGKLVHRRLREQSFKLVSFLENMKLELDEMQAYLAKKDETNSWEEVACEWITSNRERWTNWVPKDTTCIAGFGLVDVGGASVSSREAAVGCSLCTPGTSSEAMFDDIGRTYTCEFCSAGSYQELSGETLCISCPAGRIAPEEGLSQCEACPPGTYANSSGLKKCQACGSDDSLTWTTSRKTELRGSEQWIEVEAAISENFCHCIPGFYLSKKDHRCYECTEGASCPGSSEVEIEPGYFRNPLSCPGGAPGTCALGRENTSVACSACMAGLHPTETGCEPCAGQDNNSGSGSD
eukprot:Skav214280  [mRNA]  locus=scaffold642:580176:595216:- [translate_table: standard]